MSGTDKGDAAGVVTGDAIMDGAARILWGMSWASVQEESGRAHLLAGREITEIMPAVPLAAVTDAARMIGMIEQANGAGSHTLLNRAAMADAKGDEHRAQELFRDTAYEVRFGECLAFMVTGNGVSWFDDHAEFDLNVPLFEPLATIDAAEMSDGADRGGLQPG